MSRREESTTRPAAMRAAGLPPGRRAAMAVAALSVAVGSVVVPSPAQAAVETVEPASQSVLEDAPGDAGNIDVDRLRQQVERAEARAQRADARVQRVEESAERAERRIERLRERAARLAERRPERAELLTERAERLTERVAQAVERARLRAEEARRRAEELAERLRSYEDALEEEAAGLVGIAQCTEMDPHQTLTLRELNAAIDADDAHAMGVDGSGVDIAVIDTGVQEVTGLQGQVVEGIDLSFDQGSDALRGQDLHGHGTAMASIAASTGARGGDGVAPGARIVDVRVGAGDGTVDVSQVIAAIDWVVANRNTDGRNIRVINLAYSTDSQQDPAVDPLSRAVEDAWHAGVVVVVAGGNEGERKAGLGSPATNPYVIAVGAASLKGDDDDEWRAAKWSSYGDKDRDIDVLAPGERVLSAGVAGSYLASHHPSATCAAGDEVYLRGSGTSQAAAAVAGASALLLSHRPELTPDQVKRLLSKSAEEVDGAKLQRGDGLIDVHEALEDNPPSGRKSVQDHERSSGLGSLEAARGTLFVGPTSEQLHGELTAFGTVWDPEAWLAAKAAGTVWLLDGGEATWMGATWSGATWSGATWSGATWSGATWSGATWSGATWSGATWSGATWSGATWSGATWSGATWSGATWAGGSWTGASWTGASWTGASWTGASWTGASWT